MLFFVFLRVLRVFVVTVPSVIVLGSSQTESRAVVAALLHLLAPVAMFDVPLRSRREALFERVARRPSELAADFRRVDRVPAIMARPIGHERLQLAIAGHPERGIRSSGSEDLDRVADP